MGEAILVALITGGMALIGTVLTIMASSKKSEEKRQTAQAVMEQKMTYLATAVDELKADVRSHNNFGSHITVLETQMQDISERVKNLERGA